MNKNYGDGTFDPNIFRKVSPFPGINVFLRGVHFGPWKSVEFAGFTTTSTLASVNGTARLS
jgi:hypothetical protein